MKKYMLALLALTCGAVIVLAEGAAPGAGSPAPSAGTPAPAVAPPPTVDATPAQPGTMPADAAQPADVAQSAKPKPNMLMQFMPFIAIFGIMYFLMIRPQQKKQRQKEELLKRVAVGDKIITTGGIYGVVTQVKEESIRVKIDDNARIELTKAAVGTIIERADGKPAQV